MTSVPRRTAFIDLRGGDLGSTDAVPEHHAHPGARRLHLGDAVLEATLRLAAGDEKVAATKSEGKRLPTSLRA